MKTSVADSAASLASEQTATQAQRKSEEARQRVLRQGDASLHDLVNVAPGTPGAVIQSLWRDGLVDCVRLSRDRHGYTVTHYQTNDAGRAYVEAALAEGTEAAQVGS